MSSLRHGPPGARVVSLKPYLEAGLPLEMTTSPSGPTAIASIGPWLPGSGCGVLQAPPGGRDVATSRPSVKPHQAASTVPAPSTPARRRYALVGPARRAGAVHRAPPRAWSAAMIVLV
jgi:hypothetical protein